MLNIELGVSRIGGVTDYYVLIFNDDMCGTLNLSYITFRRSFVPGDVAFTFILMVDGH